MVDYRSGSQLLESVLRKMCSTLTHRGPDHEGYHLAPPAALGHRRLSIIDLSTGDQPMSDGDGRYWIVYNGEIYNFLEERKRLEEQGERFRTRSDTEVLICLYQLEGERMLQRLRGMFAFALWDQVEQRLFLARDRVGKKPLFYYEKDGLFLFASEIKALLEHPEVSREIDPVALDDYLSWNCVPPPRTMFTGIRKLPPGHYACFDRNGFRQNLYWDMKFKPDPSISFEEACHEVRGLLEEATRLRLISDVPLGAFLSGGIDSSLIVALMSRLSDRPVKTFSIGFEEEDWSELPYARMVAERYQTDHQEFVVKPDAIRVLPKLIYHFDEPFGDSSAIPTYYLSEMTRKHVTVALNGDGGDESFAGYDRYLATQLIGYYQKFPASFRKRLLPGLLNLFPDTGGKRTFLSRLRRFNQASLGSTEEAYCSLLEIFSPDMKAILMASSLSGLLRGHDARSYFKDFLKSEQGGEELLGHLLYADQKAYLPDDLLVKVDRMMMAHGLEGRSPLLDHRLMEYAARLPASYKLRGKTSKYLLKALARELIPTQLIHRPKQGFGVPIARWFRGELRPCVESVFRQSHFVKIGWFNREALDQLWQEHLTGRRDHGHRIWGLLNLELWQKLFIERKSIELEL